MLGPPTPEAAALPTAQRLHAHFSAANMALLLGHAATAMAEYAHDAHSTLTLTRARMLQQTDPTDASTPHTRKYACMHKCNAPE